MASAADIYQQAIKTLAAEAAGHGTLDSPSAEVFLDNPLCGDCVAMQVRVATGRIVALAHQVKGCLLCRAAAGVIGKRALGANRADIERVGGQVHALLTDRASAPSGWDELSVFAPVHGHPGRYRWGLLPFEALAAAMAHADAG